MILGCIFLQENKNACVICSLSYTFFFVGNKIAADCFKEEIIRSLKSNDRLKFAQDGAFNRVR